MDKEIILGKQLRRTISILLVLKHRVTLFHEYYDDYNNWHREQDQQKINAECSCDWDDKKIEVITLNKEAQHDVDSQDQNPFDHIEKQIIQHVDGYSF